MVVNTFQQCQKLESDLARAPEDRTWHLLLYRLKGRTTGLKQMLMHNWNFGKTLYWGLGWALPPGLDSTWGRDVWHTHSATPFGQLLCGNHPTQSHSAPLVAAIPQTFTSLG